MLTIRQCVPESQCVPSIQVMECGLAVKLHCLNLLKIEKESTKE